ncbi:MAG: cell wall metabolism sensor histidine kinase WalK [Firmicutes bacterium]|nr:cell wall metabolism sensor histidine kinase WalK [Bacillota bacterium]MCL5040464.1 cell wall metabolism sensor histidine kinase WalK [Bacillota bacterium]
MFGRSLRWKVWATISLFAITILLVLGLVVSNLFENLYFRQQSDFLVRHGRHLASLIAAGPSDEKLATQVELAKDFLDAKVVVVNQAGLVRRCAGMMGMMPGMMVPPPLLDPIQQGRITVLRGSSPFFGGEGLLVAVPVVQDQVVTGAVFLYSPLSAMTETLDAMRQVTLYSIGITLLLATALAFLLSRGMSTPLMEMKNAAQEMARGNLEVRVPIRSADELGLLAQSLNYLSRILKRNREQEQRLEGMRREFVANVSHELRSPLQLLEGYTEAILDDVPKNEAARREYLEVILDETLRLKRLVNDLLDITQIDEGKMVLAVKPLSLADLAQRLERKLCPLAQEKGVSLQVDVPGTLPPIYGDEDRLEQVVFNLLDNALRHTPSGGQVTLAARSGNAGQIKLTVQDTGEGIPAGDLPYIWDRFYKVDKARTGRQGTGLGLAIVRRIVEAHRGQVFVESVLGKGSLFTILLPTGEPTEDKAGR